VLVAQVTGGKLQTGERGTIPLTSSDYAQERWGAETIPRDSSLPYEVDLHLLDDEEETIPPTNRLDDDKEMNRPTDKLGSE